MSRVARVAVLLLALTVGAPALFAQATRFTPPVWSERAVLYEVNVRQYTPQGTLSALREHLPSLDSLGVDILWLMPVQPIGVKNRKGPLGSYYSVANYTAVDSAYGGDAAFRAFVEVAHRHGKKVILDWVANHTAFDHPWITQHPDWYVHRADGTIDNARDNEGKETDWTDVAELDYGKPAMRAEMIRAMRWWLDTMHIDGFRCDVAGGVPLDFWIDARASLAKVRSNLFWLAEAESVQTHRAFDATYGWELHHLLNDIAQGTRPTSMLDSYFARQRQQYPPTALRMYFTSNHDENSWNGTEFERMGSNHLPSFVLATTAEGSIPLIYTGQEVSNRKRLRFFERDTVDWKGASLEGFYHSMVELKHSQRALVSGVAGGHQRRLTTSGDRVYAYTRTRGNNTVLVALNFGDAAAKMSYGGLEKRGAFTDWFTKSKLVLGERGTIDVPSHGYRVLVR